MAKSILESGSSLGAQDESTHGTDPSDPIAAHDSDSSGDLPRPERMITWEWNLSLLLKSIAISVLFIAGLFGIYFWQSNRLCSELLNRAEAAEQELDFEEQTKWLRNYIRMKPQDTAVVIKFGLAADNSVPANPEDASDYQKIFDARQSLMAALAATGTNAAFDSQRKELRRRLITRLLQFGVGWAADAESQVLLLNSSNDDKQTLRWLAMALFRQRLSDIDQRRDSKKYDKITDYWKALANQPTGQVLKLAVEANPDDVELASNYIFAATNHKEWFKGGQDSIADEEIEESLNRVVIGLEKKLDDGRSQLVAWGYRQKQDPKLASQLLEAASQAALSRLKDNKDNKSDKSYEPVSDWRLCLLSAQEAFAKGNTGRTDEIIGTLRGLSTNGVPDALVEELYLAWGKSLWNAGQNDAAIEAWKNGAKLVNGSLGLAQAIAERFSLVNRIDDAELALSDFRKLIDSRANALRVAAQKAVSERLREKKLLDISAWNADVIEGRVRMARGEYQKAKDLLVGAFNSPLDIPVTERLNAGVLASDCLGTLNYWDGAAQILKQCEALAPNDSGLRARTARAFQRMGSLDDARSKFETSDDGSFASALNLAQLAVLGAKSESSQKMAVKAIKLARDRWNAMAPDKKANSPRWPLELLELSFSSDSEKKEVDLQSRADKLESLAAEFESVSEVQRLAVGSLAFLGRIEASNQALKRLQIIANVSGSSTDAAHAVIAEASMHAATNELERAFDCLNAGAAKIPSELLLLKKAAAELAMRQQKTELAFDYIHGVPEEKIDIEGLLLISQLAGMSNPSWRAKITEDDFARWEKRVMEIEGESGCNWRFLAIQQLLRKANRTKQFQSNQELLRQAEEHFRFIDRSRPLWGLGAAAGGQIAAIKGNQKEAVELLRRAIRLGDQRPATVLLLVGALSESNQFDEALEELKRLSPGDQTTMVEVSLLEMKGQLREALELARKAAASSRVGFGPWLVVANTALLLAASSSTPEKEKASLKSEAWDALEKATSFSGGKSLDVWKARFQYAVTAGNRENALQEIASLQSSPIPRRDYLPTLSLFYLELDDLSKAEQTALEAIQLSPNSALAYVTKAAIDERFGNFDGLTKNLKEAFKLNPTNIEIRERLAKAYLLYTPASAPMAWEDIDKLLGDEESTTSTRTRVLRASFYVQKGDDKRQAAGLATLHTIAATGERESVDAKRLLAKHYANKWIAKTKLQRESSDSQTEYRKAIEFYSDLLNGTNPEVNDFSGMALMLAEDELYADSTRVIERMELKFGVSPIALGLRLRIARANGEDLQAAAARWVEGVKNRPIEESWETVGNALSAFNLKSEAVTWYEKAYQKNPDRLFSYASALMRAGRPQEALEICLDKLRKDNQPKTAAILIEVAMLGKLDALPKNIESEIEKTTKDHSGSAVVLESAATLRLLQENYGEAVRLYELAEKASGTTMRPRTINNLAIALAELPDRKAEAPGKIESAIQRFGQSAALLDSLAIVQVKLGNFEAAKKSIQEAIVKGGDARSRMRYVEILLALKDDANAKKEWSRINITEFEKLPLTASELRTLDALKARLANASGN